MIFCFFGCKINKKFLIEEIIGHFFGIFKIREGLGEAVGLSVGGLGFFL